MSRRKKVVILICIAIPSIILLNLGVQPEFWKIVFPREELEVQWVVREEYQDVFVCVDNRGHKQAIIQRVELIYLPNETLGLIWLGNWTASREGSPSFQWKVEGLELEFRQYFFNLLLGVKDLPFVRIEVETTEAIYTFYPQRSGKYTEPE